VLFLCFSMLAASNDAIGSAVSAQKVKAVMLLKMQKYFSAERGVWKEKSGKVVCYYEEDDVPASESVGQIMDGFVRTSPSLKNITLRRYDAIADFSGCNILYIPVQAENKLSNLLGALNQTPVLTISSIKRFIYRGGMLGMVMDNENQVKVEANVKNMREAGISIDPQLLEIMINVVN
jgi:hypothetical protein